MTLEHVYVYKEQKDSNRLFMKLTYKYEDPKGIHRRTYPKVSFPASLYTMPFPSIYPHMHGTDGVISVCEDLYIQKGTVRVQSGKTIEDVLFVDELIKPTAYKMTIEEIEEKLGYKVEIVSKDTKGE